MEATKTLYCERCETDVEVLVTNIFGEYEGLGYADETHVEWCQSLSDQYWTDEDLERGDR